MYDESRYLSCCQCSAVVLRDDAVRTPELHGAFCSESCAVQCIRENNPPRSVDIQLQAGDPEIRAGLQFDDLKSRPILEQE